MHYNVCILVKLQLVKEFSNLRFLRMNFIITIYNFISASQTQIGENEESYVLNNNNLNNVESYVLVGNYRQLTILVRTKTSRKILSK